VNAQWEAFENSPCEKLMETVSLHPLTDNIRGLIFPHSSDWLVVC
jgi:hypothetical protein